MSHNNYRFIKDRPERACRGETLMRLLVSTSYPKSLFSNLGIMLSECLVDQDIDGLESTAKELRGLERGYGMLDFARSFEISKQGTEVQLNLNTLKFDSGDMEIVDNKQGHERLVNFKIDEVLITLEKAEEIAKLILKVFYDVQRRNKRLPRDMSNLVWHTSNRKTGTNGQVSITSARHDYNEILEKIKHSLLKENFGILILQNVLILSDQRCRIFFKEGN